MYFTTILLYYKNCYFFLKLEFFPYYIIFSKCICKSYLFVHFRSAFYFCHNHPHNSTSVGGSQREELLIWCDVMVPWVWIPKTQTNKQITECVSVILDTYKWSLGSSTHSMGNHSPQSTFILSMSSWQSRRSFISLRAVVGTTSVIHTWKNKLRWTIQQCLTYISIWKPLHLLIRPLCVQRFMEHGVCVKIVANNLVSKAFSHF